MPMVSCEIVMNFCSVTMYCHGHRPKCSPGASASACRPASPLSAMIAPAGSGGRPKSLVTVGGTTLLARIVAFVGAFHDSARPSLVIIDAQDDETPLALTALLPTARVVRQAQPDGVANALLLAEPFLDDV